MQVIVTEGTNRRASFLTQAHLPSIVPVMASPKEALARLQLYAINVRNNQVDASSDREDEQYAARLTKSLHLLQDQVRHDEASIEKVDLRDLIGRW